MPALTIDAIYENGVLRPIFPRELGLADGQRVCVYLEVPEAPGSAIELAGRVYEGLSDEEIAEVERLALDRSHFFREPGDK